MIPDPNKALIQHQFIEFNVLATNEVLNAIALIQTKLDSIVLQLQPFEAVEGRMGNNKVRVVCNDPKILLARSEQVTLLESAVQKCRSHLESASKGFENVLSSEITAVGERIRKFESILLVLKKSNDFTLNSGVLSTLARETSPDEFHNPARPNAPSSSGSSWDDEFEKAHFDELPLYGWQERLQELWNNRPGKKPEPTPETLPPSYKSEEEDLYS